MNMNPIATANIFNSISSTLFQHQVAHILKTDYKSHYMNKEAFTLRGPVCIGKTKTSNLKRKAKHSSMFFINYKQLKKPLEAEQHMRLVPFSCVDSQGNIIYKATPGSKERTIQNQNAIFTTFETSSED